MPERPDSETRRELFDADAAEVFKRIPRLPGRLCACICGGTQEEVLREIRIAKDMGADLVDLEIGWIDFTDLKRLIYCEDIPKIVTDIVGVHTDEVRAKNIRLAIDSGADYVDINVDFGLGSKLRDELVSLARRRGCKVISSYHNFIETPPQRELRSILLNMRDAVGGDVGKFSLRARSIEDCHRVLGLILEARSLDFPLIAISMGRLGTFTRIVGPIYGAYLSYFLAGSSALGAAGQIPLKEAIRIYEDMGYLDEGSLRYHRRMEQERVRRSWERSELRSKTSKDGDRPQRGVGGRRWAPGKP